MISWHFLICYFLPTLNSFHTQDLSTANKTKNSTDSKSIALSIAEHLYNISNIFGCAVSGKAQFSISCEDVNLFDLAPLLPNETVRLEVTNSILVVFNKPLLSHLHQLQVLNLSRNHHRFITSRAFTGLENLFELDLSNNDIVALSKIFRYTKNLVKLDLSLNKIINFGSVAMAVSALTNLKALILDHNVYIRRILKVELLPLENSTLETLQLFNTTISLIEEGSFKHLRHLKVLDLSVSYLDEEGLRNVTIGLQKASIEGLFLRQLTRLKGFPYEALSLLRNSSISTLDLGYNYFPKLTPYPPLPSLSSLYLPFCSIRNIEPNTFEATPNLTKLSLRNNEIQSIGEEIALLTKLKDLSLSKQFSPTTITNFNIKDFVFENMSSIETLDLSYVKNIHTISKNQFYGLSNLIRLILGVSEIRKIGDYSFHYLASLEVLDLHANQITYLSNLTFVGLEKLKYLFLNNNNLKLEESINPFQHNSLLKSLQLHDNDIVELRPGIFSSLGNIRNLTLYRNKIVAWNHTIFNTNSNLTKLLLMKNQITQVTSAMLIDFFHVYHTLDMMENPLNCTACGMKDFQDFMLSSNISFYYPTDDILETEYRCATPKELEGEEFLRVELSLCIVYEINLVLLFASLCPSIVILISAIAFLCYFYRWYIRYWFFHFRSIIKERKVTNQEIRLYLFDAFVSYNSEDTPWIVNHLIPALEEQEPRLRLCIHERDFEVGCLITDNILDAIEASKKVILVLTDSFVKSEWCMFELHMAQHKLFDDTRDAIVLLKLTNLNKDLYTKNLRYLEKTRPSLTWTENPMGQKLFWEKLRKIL